MARAVIITGGNLGDVKPRLRLAQKYVNDQIGVVLRCSHMYSSKAWGFNADNDFLNQVMVVDTDLSPEELLAQVRILESELGRNRQQELHDKELSGENYSSRVIDVDILFYDDLVINTPELVIPHPLMQQREFVMAPLSELIPHKVHPVLGKTVAELYHELQEGHQQKSCTDGVSDDKREK